MKPARLIKLISAYFGIFIMKSAALNYSALILFVSGVFATSCTNAAPQERANHSTTVGAEFDIKQLAGDKISGSFPTTKLPQIIEKLERRLSLKKGDYESAAEFERRVAKAIEAPIIGKSRLADAFAFSLPVEKFETYKRSYIAYRYDPEARVVHFYARPMYRVINGVGDPLPGGGYREIYTLLAEEKEIRSSYLGLNAFGAGVTVTKIRRTNYEFAFLHTSFLGVFYNAVTHRSIKPEPIASLAMEPSIAAKELPKLRAYFVFKAASPFILYDYQPQEPTLESPFDQIVQSKLLYGQILGILLHSGITGSIYLRIPEDFARKIPVDSRSPAEEPGEAKAEAR
jgi:hypothetical protein